QGSLWHFRYPLVDAPPGGPAYVVVATTRPETMLGDTAVAVHPEDARYRALVGRKVRLPLVGREIPIVADAYVDPAFGSGAVKITPGHDPNDFQVARRHDLPLITIMNEDASLNDEVPAPYRGLERFAARKRVVADLAAQGLLEKEEPHTLTVGVCSRSGSVVEPRVSRQWWVKIQPLAEQAKAAVEQGHIRLEPDFQVKVFFEWMNHIEDWCISRQLWWGHRIPVWYCHNADCPEYGRTGKEIVSEEDVTRCPGCGAAKLTMDQDVLDTWFSSGLWPFSTMGWPEQTEDLRTFYPTSVLVTGYDILFFWVARMIMLGVWFNPRGKVEDAPTTPLPERVPFKEVLLHGLLRDEFGEKMSKTKGNGLDPLDMIDKYGADALRFTLAQRTVLGQDMSLPEGAIEANRNFINKIWNATKFFLGHVERLGAPPPLGQVPRQDLGRFDRVALWQLNETIDAVDRHLEARRFNEACQVLYTFFWHHVCDVYLEMTKPLLQGELGPSRQRATLATLQHV
ncbi:MAG TPA: valine--tRNA ligase, partial [bacterium]|nr:valine--tRNA ligase [bacterium]